MLRLCVPPGFLLGSWVWLSFRLLLLNFGFSSGSEDGAFFSSWLRTLVRRNSSTWPHVGPIGFRWSQLCHIMDSDEDFIDQLLPDRFTCVMELLLDECRGPLAEARSLSTFLCPFFGWSGDFLAVKNFFAFAKRCLILSIMLVDFKDNSAPQLNEFWVCNFSVDSVCLVIGELSWVSSASVPGATAFLLVSGSKLLQENLAAKRFILSDWSFDTFDFFLWRFLLSRPLLSLLLDDGIGLHFTGKLYHRDIFEIW